MAKTIFKRIIDGEIPAKIIHDDERCLAFHDVSPQAPTHVLVIPKKEISSLDAVTAEDAPLLAHMWMVIAKLAKELKLDVIPRAGGEELELTVLWDGKPLPQAKVSIAVGDAEPQEKITDQRGRVSVQPMGSGVIGVLVSRMDEELDGKLGDKPYDHGLNYLSFTCDWPLVPATRLPPIR